MLHSFAQHLHRAARAPAEKEFKPFDLCAVLRNRNVAEAGPLTALEVEEEAGSLQCLLFFSDRNDTGAKLEETPCRLHCCVNGAWTCVRPEVSRSIAHQTARALNARVWPSSDANVRVAPIITQADVVARQVLPDECCLKEERLLH